MMALSAMNVMIKRSATAGLQILRPQAIPAVGCTLGR